MKFDNLKVGMTLFDVHSVRMGNSSRRTVGVWPCYVKEIDITERRALISWNSNPAEWFSERRIDKFRAKKPILIRTAMGHRRPTREELAEIRAKAKQPQEVDA